MATVDSMLTKITALLAKCSSFVNSKTNAVGSEMVDYKDLSSAVNGMLSVTSGLIEPQGSIPINQNNVIVDVTRYAEAAVSITGCDDTSDTTATPEDVVKGKRFHVADGTATYGQLDENQLVFDWNAGQLRYGVGPGYSKDYKVDTYSLTPLACNLAKPQKITAGERYYATTDGYARPDNSTPGPTLLWTNTALSSAFSKRTVSLDLSDYSYVIVKFRGHNTLSSEADYGFGIAFVDRSDCVNTSPYMHAKTTTCNGIRRFSASSSGVSFDNPDTPMYDRTTGYTVAINASSIIPLAIWGVKGSFTDYVI